MNIRLASSVFAGALCALSLTAADNVCNVIPRPREIAFTDSRYAPQGEPKVAYEKDAAIPSEGYRLAIGADGIRIASSDAAGRFYAEKTLAQLRDDRGGWPGVRISDAPEYGFRAVLVDDARVCYGKEGLKRILDEMSEVKLNVFHWHFIEDGAWRMVMPGRPKLSERLRRNARYDRADIEEIVAYAAARHIRVVPEVEMPGHNSVVASYPECRHDGVPGLCPTNPKTIEFFKEALDCAADAFPERIVHFGGDEVGYGPWKKCPRCQAKMKELGLKDEEDLQAWFMNVMSDHLKAKGRTAMGWSDMLLNLTDNMHTNAAGWWTGYSMRKNLSKDIVINAWYGDWECAGGCGAVAANLGYRVIQYPANHCYFDYPQGLRADPVHYAPTSPIPLEAAYGWNPRSDVAPDKRANIIGVGCANWSEAGSYVNALEWKLWPRGFATAEIGWSGGEKRDYADFCRRVRRLTEVFRERGVACAPIAPSPKK